MVLMCSGVRRILKIGNHYNLKLYYRISVLNTEDDRTSQLTELPACVRKTRPIGSNGGAHTAVSAVYTVYEATVAGFMV